VTSALAILVVIGFQTRPAALALAFGLAISTLSSNVWWTLDFDHADSTEVPLKVYCQVNNERVLKSRSIQNLG
jgi:uncharacterized membrane protein YphA (DoxX/SURF4 family)